MPSDTVAARTRAAVRADPFLYHALRAGVVNYTAAARYLDTGEPEPVAAALRRFAEDLPPYEADARTAPVTMQSGVGPADADDALLSVGDTGFAADGGDKTAVVATGEVDAAALARVLCRLTTADVEVSAAGVAGDTLVVVVERRAGADAVRVVEDALDAVPA
jgi:hypothetical protein